MIYLISNSKRCVCSCLKPGFSPILSAGLKLIALNNC